MSGSGISDMSLSSIDFRKSADRRCVPPVDRETVAPTSLIFAEIFGITGPCASLRLWRHRW
jgi:hypothetical protein